MLLAIDIGNTNTVFAVYDGQNLIKSWRCTTVSSRSADEYAAFISNLFSLTRIGLKDINGVIISSVVPQANFHITSFSKEYLGQEPLIVDHDTIDIEIDLDRPEDVGADRLVNAVALKAHYQMPAVVVDFGTATTFDVIDGQGRYAGGVISPGINLSMAALHQAAARLPSVSIKKPARIIGKSTVSAMHSGLYWGYMGLIEGLIHNIAAELGETPFVLATGGLAPLFAKDTDTIDTVDDMLTLKGLLLIYQQNQSNRG